MTVVNSHPTYQNISKILSEKWKCSSNIVLGFSRTVCKLRVCAPCRALVGACTNRDPRTAEESWLRKVMHWGPIIAILIIATVTLSSTYTALQMWSLPVSTLLERNPVLMLDVFVADSHILEFLQGHEGAGLCSCRLETSKFPPTKF